MSGTSFEHGRSPAALRCALIGDEPLVIQCAELAAAAGLTVTLIATDDPWVAAEAAAAGTPVVTPGAGLADALRAAEVDVLFSVANLRILPAEVLDAVRLAVNFHDGPLPSYAGMHVTTWALLAGETEHGVTWHVMTQDVDGGAILAEERFAIAPDETAYSLNARCFEAALRSFPAVAAAIAAGPPSTRPQAPGELRMFGRHLRPGSRSLVDPRRPAPELVRVGRALDLGDRTPNRIGRSRLVSPNGAWLLAGVDVDNAVLGEGDVRAVDGALLIGAAGGTLRAVHLTELDGAPAAAEAVAARIGTRLAPPDPALVETLDTTDAELSKAEAAWSRRLADLPQPLGPELGDGSGWDEVAVAHLPGVDLALAAAVTATWAARLGGATSAAVGVVDGPTGARLAALAPLAAPPVVTVTPTTESDQRVVVADAVAAAVARGPWLIDLLARMPALAGSRPPGIVVDAGPGRAPTVGEWLRVCLGADGAVVLRYDRACLSPARAGRVAGQLAAMLNASAADPDRPLALLPVCGPADVAALAELAAPALEHDRTRTVWDDLRHGLAARGDEPALTAGTESWTGTALLDAAERMAAALLDAGVQPGDRIGVALPRRPELVVAVLATLAAGAAYVPLDPTYPEERLRLVAGDAGLAALITDSDIGPRIAPTGCRILSPHAIAPAGTGDVLTGPAATDVAYVIYTSGSTGRPKGVQVEHRHVVAFFAAMDRVIDHDPPGTWLAVTSLSFDISVLELLWTLSRRFHVVLASDRANTGTAPALTRPADLSLFYFAAASAPDGYRLLLDGARFADANGFAAVWTPERHFHDFGGPYPNPSVTAAAVAAVTNRVAVRAGSVVLPLHSPLRVAEEWAVVDNLSGGRAGISVAAGWMPEDFVLNPTAHADAKQRMFRDLEVVRRLWRGETMEMPGPDGRPVAVRTLPRPVQSELPVWLTSAGSSSTFIAAGELGTGVLTHMLGQSPDALAANIAAYRAAWRSAGHEGEGHVALMVHTFVGEDPARVRQLVRDPLAAYLRTSVSLLKDVASAFPTFAGAHGDADDLFASLSEDELDQLLDAAVDRYCSTSGLIGTAESVTAQAQRFAALGVDEFACLIDFGIDTDEVLASLPLLGRVRDALSIAPSADEPPAENVATLVARHHVTHLQCTPSQAAMLAADPADRAALSAVGHLLVGGEALPTVLAGELRAILPGRFTNMYGPTETTIWSLTHEITEVPRAGVPIGRPIAGTTIAVVDANLQPLPPGSPGELVIGGEGVTRGYLDRPDLTADRFTSVPGIERAYRTGDVARVTPTGVVEFLGRSDHQVKLRGHRIELGEIETALASHPDVGQAVVVAHGSGADTTLLGYVVQADGTRPDEDALRAHVGRILPEIMVPARAIVLDAFPLTPNGKIDRKALPAPGAGTRALKGGVPDDDLERIVAGIWTEVLNRPVGRDDNFFEIGGHSLAAVKVFSRLIAATGAPLSLTDVFQHPTVRTTAQHLARVSAPGAATAGDAPAAGTDRGSRRRQLLARRLAETP